MVSDFILWTQLAPNISLLILKTIERTKQVRCIRTQSAVQQFDK